MAQHNGADDRTLSTMVPMTEHKCTEMSHCTTAAVLLSFQFVNNFCRVSQPAACFLHKYPQVDV